MHLFFYIIYLLYYGSCAGCIGCVQDLSHQHWLEEGPGNSSSCGVDHVQVHVHTKGSYTKTQKRSRSDIQHSKVEEAFFARHAKSQELQIL